MRSWRGPIAALVLAAIVVAPALVLAQGKSKDKNRERRDPISRIIEHRAEINLSDDQVVQLESIRDRYKDQNTALRDQIHQTIGEKSRPSEGMKNLSPEERHEAMKKHHEELLAKHPELVSAFDQLKANHEAQRNDLEMVLTPAQHDKLKQMHKEWREKARAEGSGHSG